MEFQNCISKSAFINSKIFQKGTVQQIDINQSRCGPSIHRPSSTTWAIFCSFPIKMPRWINYSKHLPLILSFGCQLLHVYKIQSNNFISFHFVSFRIIWQLFFFILCCFLALSLGFSFWFLCSACLISAAGCCLLWTDDPLFFRRVSLLTCAAIFCGIMSSVRYLVPSANA